MARNPRLRGPDGRFLGKGQSPGRGSGGGVSFNVEIDAEKVAGALNAFANRGFAPLMQILAQLVEGQTKRRIASEKRSPDGAAWKPLSPLTIAARRKGSSGALTDTGRLLGSISGTSTATSATVGTNLFYAPFHQYGVKSIKPKNAKALRIPMGGGGFAFAKETSIPARPFMGVSDANMKEIIRVVTVYMERIG